MSAAFNQSAGVLRGLVLTEVGADLKHATSGKSWYVLLLEKEEIRCSNKLYVVQKLQSVQGPFERRNMTAYRLGVFYPI